MLKNVSMSILSGCKEFISEVTTSLAVENTLSLGTEVTGTQGHSLTNPARRGNSSWWSFHHISGLLLRSRGETRSLYFHTSPSTRCILVTESEGCMANPYSSPMISFNAGGIWWNLCCPGSYLHLLLSQWRVGLRFLRTPVGASKHSWLEEPWTWGPGQMLATGLGTLEDQCTSFEGHSSG